MELLRAWRSYGPGWDDAIAMGIDVSLLEENLQLTPAQRLEQLDRMSRLWWSLRSQDEEPTDGPPGYPDADPAAPELRAIRDRLTGD